MCEEECRPIYDETKVWDKARQQVTELENAAPPVQEMYLLRCWGSNEDNPQFNEKFGEPAEVPLFPEDDPRKIHAWWFTTIDEREQFRLTVRKWIKDQDPKATMVESVEQGRLVKKRAILNMVMRFEGKDYPVRHACSYGYQMSTTIFSWEENNWSCDHNRAVDFDRFHPGVIPDDHPARESCGPSYLEVIDASFELVD